MLVAIALLITPFITINNYYLSLSSSKMNGNNSQKQASPLQQSCSQLNLINSNLEMYIEAQVWLKRWYRSSNWGQETKFYLEETDKYEGKSCPAVHFIEYES